MSLRWVWKLTTRQAWGTAWPSDPDKLSAAAAPAKQGQADSAYSGAPAYKLRRAGRGKQGCLEALFTTCSSQHAGSGSLREALA